MAGFMMLPSIQTTSSQSAPWAPAQPGLQTALQGGMDAYKQTSGLPYIAELDPSVSAGQSAALGIAGQGATTDAARTGIGGVRDILASGGIGAPMQYGIDTMKGAVSSLSPIASGQYLTDNPYLEGILRKATDAVNAQFAKSGRYGSGAYAGALGTSLADIRYKNFIDMLNAQLAANQQIGGLAQGVAGIGERGQQDVLQGGTALQSYQQPLYSDASKMSEIGGQKMDYEQAKLDAARAGPWDAVTRLAELSGGIGGLGGTSSSTSVGIGPVQKQDTPGALQTASGVGLGLLGAGGAAGGFGKLFKF